MSSRLTTSCRSKLSLAKISSKKTSGNNGKPLFYIKFEEKCHELHFHPGTLPSGPDL